MCAAPIHRRLHNCPRNTLLVCLVLLMLHFTIRSTAATEVSMVESGPSTDLSSQVDDWYRTYNQIISQHDLPDNNDGGGVVFPENEVPRSRSCGELASQFKIAGGRRASLGRWPWMAALQIRKRVGIFQSGPIKCGGVLVSHRHVLTAAHCVHNAADVQVQVGHLSYFASDDGDVSSTRRQYSAQRVFIHEKYRFDAAHHYDIAVIKLSRNVDVDDAIWPICLPPPGNGLPVDGQKAQVIGWGKRRPADPYGPDHLMEVEVPVWTTAECTRFDSRYSFDGEAQMCAGPRQGGKGICQGDSGGPLMYETSSDHWTVIGIVSLGYGCGEANRPGIYSRVSYYTDWILEKLYN